MAANKTANGQYPFSVKLHSSRTPISWRMAQNAAEQFQEWVKIKTKQFDGLTQNAIMRAAVELMQDDPTIEAKVIKRAREISHPQKRTNVNA